MYIKSSLKPVRLQFDIKAYPCIEMIFLPKPPYLLCTEPPTLFPQTIYFSSRQFDMLPLHLENVLSLVPLTTLLSTSQIWWFLCKSITQPTRLLMGNRPSVLDLVFIKFPGTVSVIISGERFCASAHRNQLPGTCYPGVTAIPQEERLATSHKQRQGSTYC